MSSALRGMQAERPFVDTNVWIYALDEAEPLKRARALEIVTPETTASIRLSTQVLQEFYAVARRRFAPALTPVQIAAVMEPMFDLRVETVTPAHIRRAIVRSAEQSLSFWDALIVEAAISSGADVIYTEELQHGQRFGAVQVINPFKDI